MSPSNLFIQLLYLALDMSNTIQAIHLCQHVPVLLHYETFTSGKNLS